MILQVNEIFESISGEAGWFPQGSWCTFVRLQGCNLHCQWCDTKKALDHFAGMKMSVDEIVAQCKTPRVLITGGEPLMQIDGLEVLLEALIEKADKHVQVETNGSFSIPRWEGVEWVVDYKPPSSGCSLEAHEAFDDGSVLKTESMVKFVIAGLADLADALRKAQELMNAGYNEQFIFSPAGLDHPDVKLFPAIISYIRGLHANPDLINRIVFSLQLHKILNMP